MRSCAGISTQSRDIWSAPYETEVNLAALKWIESLAQKLTRGYVLAVDYGYSRDDFYAPERSSGTLQCRARHRIIGSPLSDIGHIDITAHVDWTSLAARGERRGLGSGRVYRSTSLHHRSRDRFDAGTV